MLQEAIYKFKASGPIVLPDLIDNYYLGHVTAYEDYAILPYEVHQPQTMESVIEMMEMNADLAILFEDLRLHEKRGTFKVKREYVQIMNDFNCGL